MPTSLSDWASLAVCVATVYFIVRAVRAAASIARWGGRDDD